MAHSAYAAAAVAPCHDLRRQTQPSSNTPQIIAGQHDILPPAAAVAAARTGKTELCIPFQQRHGIGTGKIYLSAQVNGFVSHSQTSFSVIECPYCTAEISSLQGEPCVARLFLSASFRYTCTASRMLYCSVPWSPGAASVTRMYSFPFTVARLARHSPAAAVYPVLPPSICAPSGSSVPSSLPKSVLVSETPSGCCAVAVVV